MKKTLKKTFGILAISAMIPVAAWATGEIKGPPQWAFDACVGKSAGDAVQLTTPRGKTVSAICKEFDGKLAAKPTHEGNSFRKNGKGSGWGGPRYRQNAEAGHWKGGKGFGMRFGSDNCSLIKALNLTPEQKTEIRKIMNDERQKNANLIEQLRNSRESFREAAVKSPFDEAAVRKIAVEREQLRTELAVSWASAINRAMSVLTPEQKETAAQIGIFKHGMEPGHGWGKGNGYGRKWKDGPHNGRGPNPDCIFKK